MVYHILSFEGYLPKYRRVSTLWDSISLTLLKNTVGSITMRYPEWETENGMVTLNRAALDNEWDIFRLIMHMNPLILCDDAMEIAYIFHKDNLVHLMYNLYSERNGYSPIRAYYMWQHDVPGKEEALDNMMGIIRYYDHNCLCDRITLPMREYIKNKYGRATFTPTNDTLIYKDRYYPLHHRSLCHEMKIVTSSQLEMYTTAIINKTLKPHGAMNAILYDIYKQHNPGPALYLFKSKLYTTKNIPKPSTCIIYALDLQSNIRCEVLLKKNGTVCKHRAKYRIDGIHCCGVHGKRPK